ncbi:3-dehydroquinate synthase II [Methanocorpusculum labreanum Z]|uniref:3-dehydroquinate synthase n=1 Tax=Methanocorpusculum labreanum (strain ATCC 43576 / DSM 4855 / Z) TaxID=410358 RepID=DHQS_METLZ|nr:3-dehydroquinate synthase II [Methanocorpusculum labreanum]A2SU08.1 RecName: Full=3-dehydroquinate synthase; Short=DHQ synthase; AltName: Full=3-dehydroquinate synthase II [Methanocorpusculum labreanum Z]ABN07814.1 3-dehydroquinate synthase II [Methanocorpusculum labreanum Z]
MTIQLPPILIRADHLQTYDERKAIVASALESGYTHIILRPEDEALRHLGRYTAILADGKNLMYSGERIGVLLNLTGAEEMEEAYSLKNAVPNLIISPENWKVIPLENLISRFQNAETSVYICVKTPEEARLAFQTMEVGCDGIVITPDGPADLAAFSGIRNDEYPIVDLETAVVTKISTLSLGDRVCIDTCSLLERGEGMLIGSQSSCLFLVCSESFESEYVNSRPFRVNAGAVHSYILCPDGTTKYLSEIASGNELLSRMPDGNLRTVNVGRVKIEIRPMLYIEAKAGGKTYSVVLQNAETIRLGTPSGAVSVSDLAIGDLVYVRLESGGRHFGHTMAETICEK